MIMNNIGLLRQLFKSDKAAQEKPVKQFRVGWNAMNWPAFVFNPRFAIINVESTLQHQFPVVLNPRPFDGSLARRHQGIGVIGAVK